jgi:hypothetical protein
MEEEEELPTEHTEYTEESEAEKSEFSFPCVPWAKGFFRKSPRPRDSCGKRGLDGAI